MDNHKIKAQVTLEYALSFVMLVLFIVLSAKIFAWMGKTIVDRHRAYENSRTMTTTAAAADSSVEFFTKKPLDVFDEN